MNNPIWIDDKGKIVEPEYCRDFLSRHPMRCINDHFYTVDGPLPDESKLKRTIYEEISPWLHDKVAQTVEQVLKTLKLAACTGTLAALPFGTAGAGGYSRLAGVSGLLPDSIHQRTENAHADRQGR